MKKRRNRISTRRGNRNNTTKILIGVLGALIVVAMVIAVVAFKEPKKEEPIKEIQEVQEEVTDVYKPKEIVLDDNLEDIEALISKEDIHNIEVYDQYSFYNSLDFRGIIRFKSGLIEEPFVQGDDNDMYLRRDWITGDYIVMGSIFMDYECNLDSQNIILYGHNAFSSYYAGKDANGNELVNDELMFTPLKFLTKYENYENNKYVDVVLKNEVINYEIVSVYYCPLSGSGDYLYPDQDLQYYLPEYSNDYFSTYKSKIKSVEFYNTGVDFSNSDRYLTLQTCVEGNNMVREIVLCKQIGSNKLDRNKYAEYTTRLDKYNKQLAEIENQEYE